VNENAYPEKHEHKQKYSAHTEVFGGEECVRKAATTHADLRPVFTQTWGYWSPGRDRMREAFRMKPPALEIGVLARPLVADALRGDALVLPLPCGATAKLFGLFPDTDDITVAGDGLNGVYGVIAGVDGGRGTEWVCCLVGLWRSGEDDCNTRATCIA
jgi:hypothetical protein